MPSFLLSLDRRERLMERNNRGVSRLILLNWSPVTNIQALQGV
jgi:hypothetical protein